MDGSSNHTWLQECQTFLKFCSIICTYNTIHIIVIKMNKIQYCNLNIMALYLHIRTHIRVRIYIILYNNTYIYKFSLSLQSRKSQ